MSDQLEDELLSIAIIKRGRKVLALRSARPQRSPQTVWGFRRPDSTRIAHARVQSNAFSRSWTFSRVIGSHAHGHALT